MEASPAFLRQAADDRTARKEQPQYISAGDEVAAAFDKYNSNGDGLLSLEELRVLLNDADYQG
eukprot:COSAG02_NODE_21015_length_806_cov_1.127298_1_plen_62_part_10